jgi:hypothetical protein
MTFVEILLTSAKGMWPSVLVGPLLLIPFIILEQLRPVGAAPGWRDYRMNVLISLSTAYLALPFGIAAGLWSAELRQHLPWKSLSITFHTLGTLPVAGPVLEMAAMILVPLVLHDMWSRAPLGSDERAAQVGHPR